MSTGLAIAWLEGNRARASIGPLRMSWVASPSAGLTPCASSLASGRFEAPTDALFKESPTLEVSPRE